MKKFVTFINRALSSCLIATAIFLQVADAGVVPVTVVVTGVSPSIGTTLGGTNVTISGSGFSTATSVSFNSTAATSFTVVDNTTITATTPAHAAGAVSVEVVTGLGSSVPNALFTYVTPTTQSFAYTGADQTFLVPLGVTSINVKLWAAGGGRAGGSGSFVSGDLAVIPGETLTIIAGGGGAVVTSAGATPNAYGGGGFGVWRSASEDGGGGGGRAAIRRGVTELVSAGAGGGGTKNSVGGGGGECWEVAMERVILAAVEPNPQGELRLAAQPQPRMARSTRVAMLMMGPVPAVVEVVPASTVAVAVAIPLAVALVVVAQVTSMT